MTGAISPSYLTTVYLPSAVVHFVDVQFQMVMNISELSGDFLRHEWHWYPKLQLQLPSHRQVNALSLSGTAEFVTPDATYSERQ